MKRTRFALLGLCVALAACGEKFVAHAGSEGDGGSTNTGGTDAPSAGKAGGAGKGDRAGNEDNGGTSADAGEGGGGGEADGGAGASGGPEAGGSGGLVSGAGGNAGSSGTGGSGGMLIEPTLPDGLTLWLRADRGVQVNDGRVQVWQDQSKNQTNATQITTNARPTYLATGFNGRPSLEFDGQGQFLKLAEGFGDFTKGVAGFIVAKPTKSECASMLEFSNGSEVDDVALGMWQDKWTFEVFNQYLQTGNIDHSSFTLYAVNQPVVGASELRINGSALGTLEMPLPVVPDSGMRLNNFVGHTLYADCNYFEGQISEIILYARALTSPELVLIEKYLNARWALSEQDSPTPNP